MSLISLIDDLFEKIGLPEPIILNQNPLVTPNPPSGWTDIKIGASGPAEKRKKFPNSYRLIKAWTEPYAVTWGSMPFLKGILEHVFPIGQIATENLGRHHDYPIISSYLEAMRNKDINPNVSDDVYAFQNYTASLAVLVSPLIFATVARDVKGKDILKDSRLTVSFGSKIKAMDYENIFTEQPKGYDIVEKITQTQGGALSRANIVPGLDDQAPILENIVGCEDLEDIELNFIALHRGGILTSLVTAAIAQKFKIKSNIIGVDAKRHHVDGGNSTVAGAYLKIPPGYSPSDYSSLYGTEKNPSSFVFPKEAIPISGKKIKHIFFDPMLATGVSTEEAIKDYKEITKCKYSDIYVVALFAGGYEGINKLQKLGVNVLILGAHDQADLTGSGYIQAGLGDAGDKVFGLDEITDPSKFAEIMQNMYSNLAKSMPTLANELYTQFNGYNRQITGKELSR